MLRCVRTAWIASVVSWAGLFSVSGCSRDVATDLSLVSPVHASESPPVVVPAVAEIARPPDTDPQCSARCWTRYLQGCKSCSQHRPHPTCYSHTMTEYKQCIGGC